MPETFRFTVKVPRSITHAGRHFVGPNAHKPIDEFVAQVKPFGVAPWMHFSCSCRRDRRSPLTNSASGISWRAARRLRRKGGTGTATPDVVHDRPRKPCWSPFKVARVAADPALLPTAGQDGWLGRTLRITGSMVRRGSISRRMTQA